MAMSFTRPRMGRSFRPVFRRFRRRRSLRWLANSVGTGLLGPDSSTRLVIIPAGTMQATGIGHPTILRMRGELLITIAQPLAGPSLLPGDQAQLYFGIGPQDTVQGIAGGDFEDPFTKSFTDDWMWWGSTYMLNADEVTGSSRNSFTAGARYIMDVKAKRRLDESDDLVAVFVNVAPVQQPVGCAAALSLRVLFGGS